MAANAPPALGTGSDPDDAAREGALPPELLAELVRRGSLRVLPRHAIVVTEGEPSLSMYAVLEGRLRVFVCGEDGREVPLNEIGPGEYFGESMLDGQTRSASVQTLTRCRLCMVTRDEFLALLGERPDLAFHLIQKLLQRVRWLSHHVQGLVALDVYERVTRLLNDHAQPQDGRLVAPGRWSQQRIGDLVGASRSMVNRVLKALTEGGYIAVESKGIVLLKPLPKHW